MQKLNGGTKTFYLKNGPFRMNIYWYIQEIEGEPFKKFYIADLRQLTEEEITIAFKEFDTIQDETVRDDFFFKAAQNLYFYFLCDDKQKYQSMASEAIKDLRYAFKLLVTEEDLNLILANNINIPKVNPEENLVINGKELKIGNFNLIYGGNGSGKTILLNEIGKYYHVTPYNMDRIGSNPEITLEDSQYLQAFASESDYMYNYYLYLMSIIIVSKNNNTPILLDDLGWNGLDVINHIKIITLLNEASFEQRTFITAPQEKIKSLVKGNVYKPNIIEL